ncbi:hypothetical protein OG196_03320 [Kitasatospora purpeofusca]|uniref:hypothetical protein n=1 Tax=Kitasatospora purpeofusca TaxID=67352 RepID=UPI002E10476D|nr:hypothetical protein OG715_02740 [Kitasatospora purpeofusca]WSR38184.1 hypothetical protein OG196_03320 [Kitasatospora purpeofusca]
MTPPPPGRVDPDLADRLTDAVLLSGLPVAFGEEGPGVRIRPARPASDADRCAGAAALDWLPSPRLAGAAAMAEPGQPAGPAREVVGTAMENALAEFLPAFGLEAARDGSGRELRVAPPALPAAGLRVPPRVLAARPAGPTPAELGVPAALLDALRRSTALAGLPLAAHLGGTGITLAPCSSAEGPGTDPTGDPTGGPGADGAADLGWNPSRRLADLADSDRPEAPAAATARAAVDAAMRHALGTALRACGTELRWLHALQRLRVYGESAPTIRR